MAETKEQHKKIKFKCVVVISIGQCLDILGEKAVLVFQILQVRTSSDLH